MHQCQWNGTTFLVPDQYTKQVRNRLGDSVTLHPLTDLTPLKSSRSLNLLVDDHRFTGRFLARNLDFCGNGRPFPLLMDPGPAPDHSFTAHINDGEVLYQVLNLAEGKLAPESPESYRVVICGLGDVGGTLSTGLRLLGDETISEILLYDRSESKLQRWYREASQILKPDGSYMPPVRIIEKKDLFQGDVFIFCVSAGVPPLGEEAGRDVRMIQLERNAEILKEYVKLAQECDYQGHFFIVSDPVDQLCMTAWQSGSLHSQQIRGFGLGVMYARAVFHAKEQNLPMDELRVYGPHGEGLQVLDRITKYHEAQSELLTEKTRTENLTIRATGFKPYIAPALSSGALSILACLKGQWHYSSTLMDGVWFGARNRQHGQYNEYEALPLTESFLEKLEATRVNLINSMTGVTP